MNLLWRLHCERNGLAPDYTTSPIQLGMRGDPWRVLCACTLLNRAAGEQVRPVLRELFDRWPSAVTMASATDSWLDMERLMNPLGFQNRRTITLLKMSAQFVYGDWATVSELYGVGPYAADSVNIFCLGRLDVNPGDSVLRRFLEAIR